AALTTIRTIFLTGALLLLCATGFAQRNWPSEMWHEGKIVLVDGDTLAGLVKYDFQQNLVQFTANNKKAKIFTARKVLFVEIFDETVHKYRKLFVLPYSNTSNFR